MVAIALLAILLGLAAHYVLGLDRTYQDPECGKQHLGCFGDCSKRGRKAWTRRFGLREYGRFDLRDRFQLGDRMVDHTAAGTPIKTVVAPTGGLTVTGDGTGIASSVTFSTGMRTAPLVPGTIHGM